MFTFDFNMTLTPILVSLGIRPLILSKLKAFMTFSDAVNHIKKNFQRG